MKGGSDMRNGILILILFYVFGFLIGVLVSLWVFPLLTGRFKAYTSHPTVTPSSCSSHATSGVSS